MDARRVRDEFAARFDRPCEVVARAPGRVNLIGEHTDYNGGFVLPFALEQSTRVAGAARLDDVARVYSVELDEEARWPVQRWRDNARPAWTSYVAGVGNALLELGACPCGFDLLIQSDVPIGSGLSSSAALEVATAMALSRLVNATMQPDDLARLCCRVERDFVGVPCGIMDQFVSVLAEAGAALLLDCRQESWDHIPIRLGGYEFLVIDSGVRRRLAMSAYERRRLECDQAVAFFQGVNPKVRSLRDVSVRDVHEHRSAMDADLAARSLHVVTENERTRAAAAALRGGETKRLGQLLLESHRSLRDDYRVSCEELDALVDILTNVEGVLGARLTGAGFGGCVIGIAREGCIARVERALKDKYDDAGIGCSRLMRVRPGRGASIEYAREAD
ncbi:MAG: galactokinase [Planctomycetes bacterium]|nr:galactokinase [Planctomycetota bacterium]